MLITLPPNTKNTEARKKHAEWEGVFAFRRGDSIMHNPYLVIYGFQTTDQAILNKHWSDGFVREMNRAKRMIGR